MTRAYFTLKVEHGDTLHSHGTVVTSVDRDLLIGQTAACQLSLPKDGKHVEVEYALIQKVDNGTRVSSPADKNEAWKLIVLSPYKQHEVRVNGMAVNYVCFLNDGDIISFAGQEIEKHIINGGNLDEIMTAFREELADSDFFQALTKTANEEATENQEQETAKRTRKK